MNTVNYKKNLSPTSVHQPDSFDPDHVKSRTVKPVFIGNVSMETTKIEKEGDEFTDSSQEADIANISFKNKVLEFCQKNHLPFPVYVHEAFGPDHMKTWTVKSSYNDKVYIVTSKTVKEGERKVSKQILNDLIDDCCESSQETDTSVISYKNKVLEYCQKNHLPFPVYEPNAFGPDHLKKWTVKSLYNGKVYLETAATVKEGEQRVSRQILNDLLRRNERKIKDTAIFSPDFWPQDNLMFSSNDSIFRPEYEVESSKIVRSDEKVVSKLILDDLVQGISAINSPNEKEDNSLKISYASPEVADMTMTGFIHTLNLFPPPTTNAFLNNNSFSSFKLSTYKTIVFVDYSSVNLSISEVRKYSKHLFVVISAKNCEKAQLTDDNVENIPCSFVKRDDVNVFLIFMVGQMFDLIKSKSVYILTKEEYGDTLSRITGGRFICSLDEIGI